MAPAQDVSFIQESRMGAETPFLCPPPDDLHQLIYTSFIQYTIIPLYIFFGPLTSLLHPHILLFCPWT